MRKLTLRLAVIAGLMLSAPAGAINKADLIACLLGQAPSTGVCPER